jgi:hypothetical protein
MSTNPLRDGNSFSENIGKSALGKAPLNRHLSAFITGSDTATGSAVIPFGTATGGLASAGSNAATQTSTHLARS